MGSGNGITILAKFCRIIIIPTSSGASKFCYEIAQRCCGRAAALRAYVSFVRSHVAGLVLGPPSLALPTCGRGVGEEEGEGLSDFLPTFPEMRRTARALIRGFRRILLCVVAKYTTMLLEKEVSAKAKFLGKKPRVVPYERIILIIQGSQKLLHFVAGDLNYRKRKTLMSMSHP